MTTSSLLRVSDLAVVYNIAGSRISAIDNVSLDVPSKGFTLGVVGESGSGKTTLGMSVMNLIERPGKIISGSIEFNGKDVLKMRKDELKQYRWRQVSMVYQSAMNSLNPVKTITDPLVEVMQVHSNLNRGEARERAVKLLGEVGIPDDRAGAYPHQLSGGMRQRVVIALALALSPKLLIADEPTSALDVVVQKQILSLLKKEILEKNLSLIFITHEILLLGGLVENVAVMYAGEIVEQGPISKVLKDPRHPYTEMLLGTLLTMDSQRTALESQRANQNEPLDGLLSRAACKYAKRCKYAFTRCQEERPQLKETDDGRLVACHKYN
ncbi:MAG TPA: ABC transporter ATP-binding protein [Nitrososphaerales archaeon]|nr:ABC transporter ATP-binding protein [Nitrososphaerales archaeon]